MNAPCRTACVCSARLSGVQSGDNPRSSRAAAMSASNVAAWLLIQALQGVANGRRGIVGFLDHRPDQAGEFRHRPGQDGPAKVEIAEHPIQRVVMIVIRRRFEEPTGCRRPVIGRRHAQCFLAGKMMKEPAFGHPGGTAQVIHRRRGIALGPDHVERRHPAAWIAHRVFSPCQPNVASISPALSIPTSRYGYNWYFLPSTQD